MNHSTSLNRAGFAGLLLAVCGLSVSQADSPERVGKTVLGLKDCIKLGVVSSLQLSDADWQVRLALARQSEAKWSRWFPYQEASYYIAPMRGPTQDATGNAIPSRWGTYQQTGYNFVFPLDFIFKLGTVERIATRGVDAVRDQRERTRRKVIYDITRAYWGVKAARATDELLEDGMEKLRSARKTLEERIAKRDKGYSRTDLYKFEAFNAEQEGNFAQAKKFVALAASILKLAMGRKEAATLKLDDEEFEAVPEIAVDEATAVRMAAERRHDLRALANAIEAKRAHVSLQRRQFAPDFYLAGAVSFAFSNVGVDRSTPLTATLAEGFGAALIAGVRWTLDFPQKMARLKQAEAEFASLAAQQELATRAIAFEARQSYQEYVEARAKLTANRRAKKSMRKWFISSILNFETGLIETRDLLEALGGYFKSMKDLLTSIYNFNVAVANIEFVTERDDR